MNYCSNCGAPVDLKVPPGEDRERHVCSSCHTIHYQNPKIVAGCLPIWQGSVLLCRRAIEPRHGLWTLPAGFMENQESVLEAAIRETLEEANARVEIIDLYTMINLPHVNQVYMMYRAELLDLDYSAGSETLELGLFTESEIPWDELAFKTIYHTLRCYFADRAGGHYRFHMGDIVRRSDQVSFVEWQAKGNDA